MRPILKPKLSRDRRLYLSTLIILQLVDDARNSTRFRPMNPDPPVTNIVFLSSMYLLILLCYQREVFKVVVGRLSMIAPSWGAAARNIFFGVGIAKQCNALFRVSSVFCVK